MKPPRKRHTKCEHEPIRDTASTRYTCRKCLRFIEATWRIVSAPIETVRMHADASGKALCATVGGFYSKPRLTLIRDLVTCERCRAKLGGLAKGNIAQRDGSEEGK